MDYSKKHPRYVSTEHEGIFRNGLLALQFDRATLIREKDWKSTYLSNQFYEFFMK
jgi:hypothetical protein